MSNEDKIMIQEILINVLNNDNYIRNEAERKLNEISANKPLLTTFLGNLLMETKENKVKILVTVLVRKFLSFKGEDDFSECWKQMSPDQKACLKKDFLTAAINESDKNIKIKICDTMATITENVFGMKETWPELIDFIYQGLSLDLDDKNLGNIESVLFLMSSIFGLIYEEMISKLDGLINVFNTFLSHNNYDLKTRTCQVIGEILGIVKKKDSKKFKDFIPKILEHIYNCLNAKNQDKNVKLCLLSINDLICAEPNIIRKWFADLFILMGKVTEDKSIEESLRELAFENIVSLVESHPKLFSNDLAKMEVFIQMLFKFALEMEDEVTEEWKTPKTLSFIEEDIVPESQLQLALAMVERLCSKMDPENILKILVKIVQELLSNNSSSWKYKYTAFMILTTMCEEITDISEIKNILPTVFENLKSEQEKIRFACMQVIEICTDQFNPVFQKTYHQELFPIMLQSINCDPCLRNKLQVAETIIGFVENCPEDIIDLYMKSSLDVLFPLLLNENSYVSLKESVINLLSELVEISPNSFKPYSSQCLEILIKVLAFLLKENKEKSIYGSLLTLITTIGPNCEENYKSYIPDITNAMISLQNSIPYSTDPIFEYLNTSWEKIIPYLTKDFTFLCKPVIECTLKLVDNLPSMKFNKKTESPLDIQNLLKSDVQENEITKQKIQVNTAETTDYAASLSLLSTILESFGNYCVEYLPYLEKMLIPLLSFDINQDIRVEAANLIPYIIEIYKNQNNTELLHSQSIKYLTNLIIVMEKEESTLGVATQINSIGSLIEKTGMFLEKNQIQEIFVKLLEVFDRIEKIRLDMIKNIGETQDELEENRKSGNNKIYSDDEEDSDEDEIIDELDREVEEVEDVLVSIADVMGSMFKTHKENTLDVVNLLLNTLLPKYFQTNASNFEVKMGIYIVDDMIEFLGQELLPKIWPELAKILLSYCDSTDPPLRQACIFGIGEFAVNTKKDFHLFSEALLNGVDKALMFTNDNQNLKQWNLARDNAISSMHKFLKYQPSYINYDEVLLKWIKALPLQYDELESEKNIKFLLEILQNQSDKVLGQNNSNLPKILRILCKVYDTKFASESDMETIKIVIKNIFNNQSYENIVKTSINEANSELQEKMKELYKSFTSTN